ncbi:MAG: hypothetical protein ACI909_003641 [Planctomycetota bacterium]|jgi:hypothetical protein
MDRVNYYFELLASVCGFDSPDTITALGLSVVLLATCILIYSFYRAVYVTIWPGETNLNHIKRRVLIEEDILDDY